MVSPNPDPNHGHRERGDGGDHEAEQAAHAAQLVVDRLCARARTQS